MSRYTLGLAVALATASCAPEAGDQPQTVETSAEAGFAATTAGGRAVMTGGDSQLDACAAHGVVSGLDPAGDGFLAVRAGPGTEFAERDRLTNGQPVVVCEEHGSWLGLVYDKAGADCGISSPQARRSEYAGPCRSGWVAASFVTITAG